MRYICKTSFFLPLTPRILVEFEEEGEEYEAKAWPNEHDRLHDGDVNLYIFLNN